MDRRGFTLIELMVVVVIIGILSGMIARGILVYLPSYIFQRSLGDFTTFYYKQVHKLMGSDATQWIMEVAPDVNECYADSLNAPSYSDTFRFSSYGVDISASGHLFININKDGSVVAPVNFTVSKSGSGGRIYTKKILINKLGEVIIK